MKSLRYLVLCGCLLQMFFSDSITADGISRSKRSTEDSSTYFYYQEPNYPKDCQEIFEQCAESQPESGVYNIQPEGADEPFSVYCNNSIDGGGWTVLQRRVDGSVEFYRNWEGYKQGFGFLGREFWLGNDKISLLTNQKDYMLRIDLNNQNGDPYFAKYDLFRISDESTNYRLVGLGVYDESSTTGYDSMANNRNQSFTTHDRDNDHDADRNRGSFCRGAWWFNEHCCGGRTGLESHLNGLYTAGDADNKSICWPRLPGGLADIKYSEMKIRPI